MNNNFDWNEIDWEARHSNSKEHPIIEAIKLKKKAIKNGAHPKIVRMLEEKLNHEVKLTAYIFSQSKRFSNFIDGELEDE